MSYRLLRTTGTLLRSYPTRDTRADADVPAELRRHEMGNVVILVHWALLGGAWKIWRAGDEADYRAEELRRADETLQMQLSSGAPTSEAA